MRRILTFLLLFITLSSLCSAGTVGITVTIVGSTAIVLEQDGPHTYIANGGSSSVTYVMAPSSTGPQMNSTKMSPADSQRFSSAVDNGLNASGPSDQAVDEVSWLSGKWRSSVSR